MALWLSVSLLLNWSVRHLDPVCNILTITEWLREVNEMKFGADRIPKA